MSKHRHNYTQYSSNKNNVNEKSKVVEETIETVLPPTNDIKLVRETVETVTLPDTIEGVVSNCAKLNVRVAPHPTAEIVCVLDAMSEIEIHISESTDEWFKICTAIGAEGYCMRKFVDARL